LSTLNHLKSSFGVESGDVLRRPSHFCGLSSLDLEVDLLVAHVRPELDALEGDLEIKKVKKMLTNLNYLTM
jgi:hypothetical protein